MHIRINAVVGAIAIVAAACSAPTDEPPQSPPDSEARDLALTPPDIAEPIASELEAPRPEPQRNGSVRPAVRRPASPEPIGNPVAAAPAPVAEPAEPAARSTTHPRVDDSVEAPVSGPYAGEAVGGKPRIPMTGERVPDPGSGIGVLIRGGSGRHGDDCARHRPPHVGDVRPPSGTGVLINERAPRRMPPQIADRTPVRGPQLGRGGIR